MMTYMNEYPVAAWFPNFDEAQEYQSSHPELSVIVICNGYGLINTNK